MNEFAIGPSYTLRQLKFGAQLLLDRRLVEDRIGGEHVIEIELHRFIDAYVAGISSRFTADIRDYHCAPRPVTWWDQFKRDAIPTITKLLRLRVNETIEVVQGAVIFPEAIMPRSGQWRNRVYYVNSEVTRTDTNDGGT